MTEHELHQDLEIRIRCRPGTTRVISREGVRLEFKQSFSFSNIAAYLRTMAAFANTRGGYLIFGIQDSPRNLVGIDVGQFDDLDVARMTTHINSHFSPSIDWTTGDLEVEGCRLGYLYTYEHRSKPIICTADAGSDLREGDIYYRYRGQTRRIRAPELQAIFDERLEREREAWRRHLAGLAETGPANLAVLDLLSGSGDSTGQTFIIDERLIEQLRFVREGRFTESAGAPTLKLIGEVRSAGLVTATRKAFYSLHFDELIEAFLGNKKLTPAEAKEHLRESFRQDSWYVPMHFFAAQAGLSEVEVLDILDNTPGVRYAAQIRKRLTGDRVSASGAVEDPLPHFMNAKTELVSELSCADTQVRQRSLLIAALKKDPGVVAEVGEELDTARFLEAVTHLEQHDLEQGAPVIRRLLQIRFANEFYDWIGPLKTSFRKAVAHMDDQLYSQST